MCTGLGSFVGRRATWLAGPGPKGVEPVVFGSVNRAQRGSRLFALIEILPSSLFVCSLSTRLTSMLC